MARPYKIVLAGENGVGKSRILRQLQREIQGVDERVAVSGRNHEKLRARVRIEGQQDPVLVDLWDTVGMERYGSQNIPSRSYFIGTHGVILVYDKDKVDTLTALNLWISNAKEYSNVKEGLLVLSLWGNQTGKVSACDDAFVKGYAEAHDIQQSLIFSVNLASRFGLTSSFQEVVQAVYQANSSITASARADMVSGPTGSTLRLLDRQQEPQRDSAHRRFKCCRK